jgi:hypothetical protein
MSALTAWWLSSQVVASSEIAAPKPASAVTGEVQVGGPGSAVLSNVSFRVLP